MTSTAVGSGTGSGTELRMPAGRALAWASGQVTGTQRPGSGSGTGPWMRRLGERPMGRDSPVMRRVAAAGMAAHAKRIPLLQPAQPITMSTSIQSGSGSGVPRRRASAAQQGTQHKATAMMPRTHTASASSQTLTHGSSQSGSRAVATRTLLAGTSWRAWKMAPRPPASPWMLRPKARL